MKSKNLNVKCQDFIRARGLICYYYYSNRLSSKKVVGGFMECCFISFGSSLVEQHVSRPMVPHRLKYLHSYQKYKNFFTFYSSCHVSPQPQLFFLISPKQQCDLPAPVITAESLSVFTCGLKHICSEDYLTRHAVSLLLNIALVLTPRLSYDYSVVIRQPYVTDTRLPQSGSAISTARNALYSQTLDRWKIR